MNRHLRMFIFAIGFDLYWILVVLFRERGLALWLALAILAREAQSQSWLNMLEQTWPDVSPGTQLAFVLNDKQGQFWYRASAMQKTFIPLGPLQSATFSANFLAIWLGSRTQYPELRQQLTGGEK